MLIWLSEHWHLFLVLGSTLWAVAWWRKPVHWSDFEKTTERTNMFS